MLARAGLDPLHAHRSATSLTEDTFGLDDRDFVALGQRGDLVFVSDDPTTDVTNLRALTAVWNNGLPVDRTLA